MGIIGGIFVLFLFSIPLLAIFLLLLFVALKFLQLSCYGLAWLCFGLGKLFEVIFERKRSVTTALVPTRGSDMTYVTRIYKEKADTVALQRKFKLVSVAQHEDEEVQAMSYICFGGDDMIPSNISRQDIMNAIDDIRKSEVPKRRGSSRFQLVVDGQAFPPKYVVSLSKQICQWRRT